MATISFGGIDEYAKKLRELERDAPKAIRFAIYPAAGLLAEELKRNTPTRTGDLRQSIAISPMRDDDGFINTKLEFAGYDRFGVPNALKAAVLEHGRSGKATGKNPFIRKSVNAAKKKAEGLMQTQLDQYYYEKMRK